MAYVNGSVNRIAGLYVDICDVVDNMLEGTIVKAVGQLLVNIQEVAAWIASVKIRDIGILDIIKQRVDHSQVGTGLQ